MRKVICKAKSIIGSFYDTRRFIDFLDNSTQAKRVMSDRQLGFEQVYWFDDKNVALHYRYNLIGNTEITLFGSEEGIGEVERIILEAAKGFKPEH